VSVLLALALGALLMMVAPSGAALHRRPPRSLRARSGSNTQLKLTGTGPGQGVSGYIANPGSTFDPTKAPYPSTPPADFSPQNESFAGVIYGTPTGGATNSLKLYCIDIRTLTYINYGYVLGTWDAANVPNVGYVAQLLDKYYPNTNEPAALTDLNQKAAAVQAAIWYFSDKYVLSSSDPLHATVANIVAAVQKAGPLVEPPPPSLTITPTQQSGPAVSVIGPFTVSTGSLRRRVRRHHRRVREALPATVTATGGTMYSDATGTTPIANGTSVPSGTKIWLKASTGSSTAVLQATAQATVPSGNVYLYDGNSGANSAQKLILSQTATLTTTVEATADFLPAGSLVLKKTIAGPAAGSQGRVVIQLSCDNGLSGSFVVDAGKAAGDYSTTHTDIPYGTTCTVYETDDGSNSSTSVTVTGNGQQVVIPSGTSATVGITNTYHFVPGSLIVRKTIAGPGAGLQGAVTIHTVCGGTALTPDFVIKAGAAAGDYTQQYDDIPAPTTCTVTETVDGHNSAVSVDVEGSGQTVSVPAGSIAEADVGDTYGLVPGQLEVTKTIAGPLAGSQGQIVIHTVCTSPNGTPVTPDFVIPPKGTGVQSHIYSGIPTPASCTVTETANGATSTVSAVATGSPSTVTIAPGGSGAAQITDTYGAVPGSLLVTKTISGPVAGHQGPVTIQVVCNNTALPDFVIPGGTAAGTVSHSFDGIPAGSACTVTETTDGATTAIQATVSGNPQTVTVPAGKVVPVSLLDVYEFTPGYLSEAFQATRGSLRVTKTIAGPAARQHGPIAILVACGGPIHAYAFLIPAHTVGSVSRVFSGLRPGSHCTVLEAVDGRTHKVTAVAHGRRQKVTIRAAGTATAHQTDIFTGVARVTG
jgi:Domain of unknown function (DUF5979)/Thioester domain